MQQQNIMCLTLRPSSWPTHEDQVPSVTKLQTIKQNASVKASGGAASPNIYFSDMNVNDSGEIERRWLMLEIMHHNNPDSPWQADSCTTWRVMYVEPCSVAHSASWNCQSRAAQTAFLHLYKLVWMCVSWLHQISLPLLTETFDKHVTRVFICNVWGPLLCRPLTVCLAILQHIICFLLGALNKHV